MKKYIAFLLSLTLLFLCSGCQMEEKPAEVESFAMSTYITQKVYGPDKEKAAEAVKVLLDSLEEKLSLFKEGSDVERINRNAGIEPVKVDDYTFELVRIAKEYSRLSENRFDITIAPLTLLWAVDSDEPHVPTQDELDQILPLVDWSKIQLDEEEQTVFLQEKGMAIDLGGIAKGYIANQIREEYQKWNVTSAVVSIGGNIDVFGRKPDGSLYTLGIRDPASVTGMLIIGTIEVEDKVVSTSGAYERYFEKDGVIYHHILDPETGFPAKSDLLSVSVISTDGGLSDYLSTTLFIAGKEAIADYIHDDRFAVIVIDQDNKVYLSDSIRDSFTLTNTEDYTLAQPSDWGE